MVSEALRPSWNKAIHLKLHLGWLWAVLLGLGNGSGHNISLSVYQPSAPLIHSLTLARVTQHNKIFENSLSSMSAGHFELHCIPPPTLWELHIAFPVIWLSWPNRACCFRCLVWLLNELWDYLNWELWSVYQSSGLSGSGVIFLNGSCVILDPDAKVVFSSRNNTVEDSE